MRPQNMTWIIRVDSGETMIWMQQKHNLFICLKRITGGIQLIRASQESQAHIPWSPNQQKDRYRLASYRETCSILSGSFCLHEIAQFVSKQQLIVEVESRA